MDRLISRSTYALYRLGAEDLLALSLTSHHLPKIRRKSRKPKTFTVSRAQRFDFRTKHIRPPADGDTCHIHKGFPATSRSSRSLPPQHRSSVMPSFLPPHASSEFRRRSSTNTPITPACCALSSLSARPSTPVLEHHLPTHCSSPPSIQLIPRCQRQSCRSPSFNKTPPSQGPRRPLSEV